jgi:hypothetical protein
MGNVKRSVARRGEGSGSKPKFLQKRRQTEHLN